MKDYRLTIKVRNNRILKAIEDCGGSPGQMWCEAHGMTYSLVNNLINMTDGPLLADGSLRKTAARLCEVVGKLPEDLWSNAQLYPLEKNFSEMEMDHEQVLALLPEGNQSYLPDFSRIEQEQVRNLVNQALSTLTPNERMVLRLRNYDDLTLDECGKRLKLSRERVRQIEAKALRKLRHPKQKAILRDALDIEP